MKATPASALPGWPGDLLAELEPHLRPMHVAPDTVLFEPGVRCEHFVIVERGTARVEMVTESGRELILYRVAPGNTCALTTACLIGERPYRATGIAETDMLLWTLDRRSFEELLGRSAGFRRMVFSGFGERMDRLMHRLEEVMTHGLDQRLATFLLARADGNAHEVAATHYRIAVELGAVREAVSRRLKSFERRGWVALRRGRVRVLDASALRRTAGTEEQRSAFHD